MPTKYSIINGPSFEPFMFDSAVLHKKGSSPVRFSILPFGLDGQELEKVKPKEIFCTVELLSREWELLSFHEEGDIMFVAKGEDQTPTTGGKGKKLWAIVGRYNPNLRHGECTWLDLEEFFTLPLAQLLYGEMSHEFYRQVGWFK